MSESIINGLFTLAGTLVGGVISFFITKSANDYKRLKSQVNILSNQIISYWNLEKIYSEEISSTSSKSAKTILQNYRDRVEELGMDRPIMTEKEAKKILMKNL